MTASDELLAACERYLSGRHVQLWGHLHCITDPADLRASAAWLAAQVEGVLVEKATRTTVVHDLGLVGDK